MVNPHTQGRDMQLTESDPPSEASSRLILANAEGLVKQTQRQTNIITILCLVITGLVVAVLVLSFKVGTIHYTNAYGGMQKSTVGHIDDLSLKDFVEDAILILGNLSKETAHDRVQWALKHMDPHLKMQFKAAMEGELGQLQRIDKHDITLKSYDLSHRTIKRVKGGKRPIYRVVTRVTQRYQVGSIHVGDRKVDAVFRVQPSLEGGSLQMVHFNLRDFYTREGKPVDVLQEGSN